MPKFRHRHYEAIAEIILGRYEASANSRLWYHKERRIELQRVAYDLAEMFKADNKSFDSNQFLIACGIDDA